MQTFIRKRDKIMPNNSFSAIKRRSYSLIRFLSPTSINTLKDVWSCSRVFVHVKLCYLFVYWGKLVFIRSYRLGEDVWNAKLTYIQKFIPIFKYLDLGTNHLYLSSNQLNLASNHLYLGTNDLKIGINDLYLGSNDLYLLVSSNTTICT